MITLTFTGDIAFSGYYKDKYKDNNLIDADILEFLNSSNYVIANIEAPITNSEMQSSREINHSMNPQVLPCLKKMHINVWNLANNHILDCGEKGLNDTLQFAKNEQIASIGANTNKKGALRSIILGKDIKIGILSYVDVWKWMKATKDKCGSICCDDYVSIKKQINELRKQKVDYILAMIHGGYEFIDMPMKEYRKKMHILLKMGVDIIVGHHPHVVQNYEVVNDKIIFYSLGNFIFDTDLQRLQKNTDKGVLLKICFDKNGYSFSYINTIINRKNGHISIAKTNNPIFTNIKKGEYKLLEPLYIKSYLDARKIMQEFLNSKKKKKVLKYEMYRYLYYFQYWRLSKRKDIINYIRDKKRK